MGFDPFYKIFLYDSDITLSMPMCFYRCAFMLTTQKCPLGNPFPAVSCPSTNS